MLTGSVEKPRIIFHIGPPKTGSSSIQAALSKMSGALIEHGIYYKPNNSHINHTHVAHQLSDGRNKIAYQYLSECRNKAKKLRCHTILFSSENFSLGRPPRLNEIFAGLDIISIGYIRDPIEVAVSAYGQVVLSDLRKWETSLRVKIPYDVGYTAFFREWIKETKLIICPFDKTQWPDNSIEKDFLQTIGCKLENVSASPPVNMGLDFVAIEAVRVLNELGIDSDTRSEFIDKMRSYTSHLPKRGSAEVIGDENIIFIKRQFSAGYEKLKPHFRVDFDSNFLLKYLE